MSVKWSDAAVTLMLFAAPIWAADWKPITPEELALKTPRVEKDADAEAIFWEVRVGDESASGSAQNVMSHYIRIKIFTETGKEKLGTVDIPYAKHTAITGIAGRTIKADGTVIPLTKDAVFDRVLAKGGGLKIRHKSFAMPGVEPGAIIEYMWKEIHSDEIAQYVHLPLQREYPVETLTYHIKPLVSPYFPFQMKGLSFNCDQPKFTPESKGYFVATYTDVPAYREEPLMPPENESKRWMLIYYEPDNNVPADKYWKDFGRKTYSETKAELKINGEVKQRAQELTSGAANDDEKLKRLLIYCQTKLRNVYSDQVTSQERETAKTNQNSAETLKRGIGTTEDIQAAFISLATAAGFDARMVQVSDRGESFFRQSYKTGYFLRNLDVAVNVNGAWRFYDPSSPNVPAGMLRWQEEGLLALVSDPKDPVFVKTPLTQPDKSSRRRVAAFTLDDQGNLEGNFRETLGGQFGLRWRLDYGKAPTDEREQNLKDEIHSQFGNADVSDMAFSVVEDVSVPVAITYKLKVANYAQRTGKRLFVAPSFFEASKQARFSASTRRYPVYFEFPWSEDDHIEIELPKGFELDHADAPSNFKFAPVGSYSVAMALTKDNKLVVDRKLVFGEGGEVLLFPAEVYPAVKKIFDRVHEADSHLLTLKVASAAPPATGAGN